MFVFRNMSYPKHAEEAIKKINEKEICGQSIIVEPSRKMIPCVYIIQLFIINVLIIKEDHGIIIHMIKKEKENDQFHQGKLIGVYNIYICLGIVKEETNAKSHIHVHDHVLIQGEINIIIIRNTEIINI